MKSYDKFIGGTFVVISVNAAASRYENIADSRIESQKDFT